MQGNEHRGIPTRAPWCSPSCKSGLEKKQGLIATVHFPPFSQIFRQVSLLRSQLWAFPHRRLGQVASARADCRGLSGTGRTGQAKSENPLRRLAISSGELRRRGRPRAAAGGGAAISARHRLPETATAEPL
ncbi:hypothetical protein SKAU_G00036710 [Synaphobranchus kaupii]|uniref:Uncharacterized protein n=1 Tax=Synaphobranchus kaupii TaxID=118154 RepID=A0A9Q1GG91_SYNKA|nr:hypothetical protein SKAU_G00036710 [Synaphobranchus kaupii]